MLSEVFDPEHMQFAAFDTDSVKEVHQVDASALKKCAVPTVDPQWH